MIVKNPKLIKMKLMPCWGRNYQLKMKKRCWLNLRTWNLRSLLKICLMFLLRYNLRNQRMNSIFLMCLPSPLWKMILKLLLLKSLLKEKVCLFVFFSGSHSSVLKCSPNNFPMPFWRNRCLHDWGIHCNCEPITLSSLLFLIRFLLPGGNNCT